MTTTTMMTEGGRRRRRRRRGAVRLGAEMDDDDGASARHAAACGGVERRRGRRRWVMTMTRSRKHKIRYALCVCVRACARVVMDEAKDEDDEGFEYSQWGELNGAGDSCMHAFIHSIRGMGHVCGVRWMCGANGGRLGEGKCETDDCVRVRGDVGRKWRA